MRLVVTGAAGMLGSELARVPGAVGFARSELDILDSGAVRQVLTRERPDWVINCAAFTRVDDCEGNEEAYRINAEGPGILAAACRELAIRLLHISTDYVFDGTKRDPYTEKDPTNPLNTYGRGKLEGEQRALAEHSEGTVVVRSAWLFGAKGRCFPRSILVAAGEGRPLRVVDDQTGCPTYTADLAPVLAKLVSLGPPPGVYHLVASGTATWYELAMATLEEAGLQCEVEPISSSEWPARAKRPAYSVLDCSKVYSLGVQPLRHWRAALSEFVRSVAHQSGIV